jgi:hypothetical protein
MKRIVAAIEGKSLTVPEIRKVTGLSQPCVQRAIDKLRLNGHAHLAEWRSIDVSAVPRWIAAYRFGKGVDAAKPGRQSIEVRRAKQRVYRSNHLRKKVDKEEAERRERIRQELARPAFRDPFIAQFFGPYEARA